MADLKSLVVKSLAGVLGSAAAAVAVFTAVPAEESGRTVAVTIAPTGQATIRHISGPQYLKAYLDAVGIPTACDGITRGVRMGQSFTEAQCNAKLEAELVDNASHVVACVPALRERPNQAAAAVILTHNIGWPSFCASTAARRFNAGEWAAGCDAFLMWDKATDPRTQRKFVLRGLAARRLRERTLCLTGLAA